MLVYKKLTTESRINTTKKVKPKKLDTEANVPDDSSHLEKLIVKDTLDILDEIKCKSETDEIQEKSPEKKLDTEDTIVVDNCVTSENADALTVRTDESVETVDVDKMKDKYDPIALDQIYRKKPVVKIVKFDYKPLNGTAHGEMSCGERDFYEEVRFNSLVIPYIIIN